MAQVRRVDRLLGLLRRRLYNSLGYSLHGLRAAYGCEEAFRVEVIAALPLLPLGLWLGEGGVERALLVVSILLVLIVELINSAIEATIDRIGEERAELSGRAKDMGSAAVLLAILSAVATWGLVLW